MSLFFFFIEVMKDQEKKEYISWEFWKINCILEKQNPHKPVATKHLYYPFKSTLLAD